MDLQDLQDDRRSDYQFGKFTQKIIGCAFEVIRLQRRSLPSTRPRLLSIERKITVDSSLWHRLDLGLEAEIGKTCNSLFFASGYSGPVVRSEGS